jgi:hypothetical protein
MVYFQTKNRTLGKFLENLVKEDVCMAIVSILLPNGIFYGHLVHFMVILYIFPRFGLLYQEKSGNPGR